MKKRNPRDPVARLLDDVREEPLPPPQPTGRVRWYDEFGNEAGSVPIPDDGHLDWRDGVFAFRLPPDCRPEGRVAIALLEGALKGEDGQAFFFMPATSALATQLTWTNLSKPTWKQCDSLHLPLLSDFPCSAIWATVSVPVTSALATRLI